MANIKYIGNDTKTLEKGKIHRRDGNQTGCGAKIDDNPQDWQSTTASITCEKEVVDKITFIYKLKIK